MNLSDTIRKAVLDGKSETIRRLLLNSQQIWLIGVVEKKSSCTAREVSNMLNISIQNASAKLNRLYAAGYIDRHAMPAETGGIEYLYTKKCEPGCVNDLNGGE